MLLVTGASGFVGRYLCRLISASKESSSTPLLACSFRTPLSGRSVQVDLSNRSAVQALFDQYPIDSVIHLAAESRPALCQKSPEIAQKVNVDSTGNLAEAVQARGGWLLYVSTDMVFDGERGTYTEEDTPAPINVYGLSKLAAERLVSTRCEKHCIVRPALIYGQGIGGSKSMLDWTVGVLNGEPGAFFEDEYRTPVWVVDLVNLLYKFYRERYCGLVHAGGLDRISRVDFARSVSQIWDTPVKEIPVSRLDLLPDNHWRPRDVSLSSVHESSFFARHHIDDALRFIYQQS